jgi:hypothetical protein
MRRILTGLVRPVRADERPHGPDQAGAIVGLAEASWRRLTQDQRGHLPAGLVLLVQHLDQVGQFLAFLELGEDELLFELLVVVLNELADQGTVVWETLGGNSSFAASRRSPSS